MKRNLLYSLALLLLCAAGWKMQRTSAEAREWQAVAIQSVTTAHEARDVAEQANAACEQWAQRYAELLELCEKRSIIISL